MQSDEEITDLRKQNEALKEKLQEFQSLEEDLMAKRVFDKARKQLLLYITLGGITLLLSGIVGIRSITDYATSLAKEKIDAITEEKVTEILKQESERQTKEKIEIITEEEITKFLQQEGERQIKVFMKEQEEYLVLITQQQVSKIVKAGLPIGNLEDQSEFTAEAGVLDYSTAMIPIRYQGNEGSSVGFAVAAALEYQIEKSMGERIIISPRHIYYNARLIGQGSTDRDSGAYIRDGITTLLETGAVAEDVWPYTEGEFDTMPPDDIDQAIHYYILQSWPVLSANELKEALERFGPVAGGFAMYSSFHDKNSAKTGRIPLPEPTDSLIGAHAVCFVGYDDEREFFKFKNSWGTDWGDNGYGYLSYEYVDKFLTDAWAISMEEPEER